MMDKQKLLIHICCAPCLVAPYLHLKDEFNITGFWYNPNIHPYQEYKRRLREVEKFETQEQFRVLYKDEYPLEKWLQNVVFREEHRCRYCYYERLVNTAIYARHGKFDFFTTTLLYSKTQDHDLVVEIGESVAKQYGIRFLNRDFRKYWKEGIEYSKQQGMYRQQYCGCVYSEKERYYKPTYPPAGG